VTLTNSGEVNLDWTAEWNVKPAWLEVVTPTLAASGTVLPGGVDSDTFTLKVDSDANGLAAGTYTGSIDITDQYSNTTTVTFTLVVKNQAALATSPTSFTVDAPEGGAYPVETLSIWNSNADNSPFDWTIDPTDKPTWLVLSSTGDSCSSETDTVDLTFDSTGLTDGFTESWTLTVSSGEATGGPVDIVVTIVVTNPYLWVDAFLGTPAGPGTEAAPYQTISQAMTVAVAGSSVIVKPGTYVEEVDLPISPIYLSSEQGAAVTTIQAPTIGTGYGVDTYGSYVSGPHTSIDGFTISGFSRGIDAYYGADIRDCIIEGNTSRGIYIGYAYGSRVERNIIRSTGDDGMWIISGRTAYVIDNLIVSNAGDGLYVSTQASEPTYIINNTFAGNAEDGLRIGGNDEDLAVVMNNIMVSNGDAGITAPGGVDSPTLGNNNVYGNGVDYIGGVVAAASDISVPPVFAGGDDYRILRTSACKDAGDNSAPGLPATDFAGKPRISNGVVDIGCHEYQAGSTTLPTITLYPDVLTFEGVVGGPFPAQQSMLIENSGTGTLNWLASDDAAWVTVLPSTGAATTETDEVTVSLNTAGLTEGWHTATVSVTDAAASNSPHEITVKVLMQAAIWVSTTGDDITGTGTEAVPYRTISHALSVAGPGNVIVVKPGTYSTNVTFDDVQHVGVTLESQMGSSTTFLDGGGAFSSTIIDTEYDAQGVTIRGFTFLNAYLGIGLGWNDRDPFLIEDCVFSGMLDNGLDSNCGSFIADGLIFDGCDVGADFCNSTTGVLMNCLFVDCVRWGMDVTASDSMTLVASNCTFVGCERGVNAAVYSVGAFQMFNSIAVGNDVGVYRFSSGPPTVGSCDVWGNTTANYYDMADPTGTDGNISTDPLFVGSGAHPYLISSSSSCIDAGDNTVPYLPTMDFRGLPRDDGSVDMGCYEWTTGDP
jgi:hypothetical protein